MPRKVTGPAEVVRVLDATGASTEGWEAAVADAVKNARGEVRSPVGVEVARMWADLSAGRITTYRVAVKIAYRQGLRAVGGARG